MFLFPDPVNPAQAEQPEGADDGVQTEQDAETTEEVTGETSA